MTDFRVTPQAAAVDLEAIKARAKHEIDEDRRVASLMCEPRNREVLLRRAQVTSDLLAEVERLAALAAAAAAPLLCQPLQDEIDRLRAELDPLRTLAGIAVPREAWESAQAEIERLKLRQLPADVCGACDQDGEVVCMLPPHSVELLPEGHPNHTRWHQDWRRGRLWAEWSSVTDDDHGRLWPDGHVGTRHSLAASPVGTGNPTPGGDRG